jgi:hypothetical protein
MSRPTLRIGRVVDDAGQAVAGAMVTIESGTALTPEITLITDSEGRFRLGLPPGRFRLRAQSTDGRSGTRDVVGGPSDEEIVIQVGGTEEGSVR